jgi:hypothetical protein
MEVTTESINTYMSLKMELTKKVFDYDTKMVMEDVDLRHPLFRSFYNFHLVFSGESNNLQETKELIEKALAK